jgi:hypothetical protein
LILTKIPESENAQDHRADTLAIGKENQHLREVIRGCARALQHNLSIRCLKDEKMMLWSLERAWAAVGRDFCEAPLEKDTL